MKEHILNIALIGCGGMATNYRQRYLEIPGARLALIVDADEKTVKEAAQQLKLNKWSTDFNACLIPEIDIVDISTPNFLHAEQAVAAMHAGKHVILQKPIAPSVEEAEMIVETSLQTGLSAGMYMSLFDNPLYYDVKKLVDSGRLGAVSGIHCRSAHGGGLSAPEGGWRSSLKKTGGGSFIQLTIHNMNMVQWLLNERIVKVMAFSRNMMCPNIGGDDVTAVACEFGNGVLGTLESAYCANGDVLSIYGSEGFISINGMRKVELQLEKPFDGELLHYGNPGKVLEIALDFDSFSLYSDSNPFDQHIAFVKSIQAGNPPPIPVEAGLYDLKVVQAVYRSAGEKRMMEVAGMNI